MRSSIFAVALCGMTAAGLACAQSYPFKPVRLVIPFPAGGPVDTLARILAPKIIEGLGQQLIVDSRPGANGNIGGEFVARSPADGYTLLLVASSFATNPLLYKKQPFDPFNDFAPVTLMTLAPMLLVAHPSLPAKSIKDLIALAKARPGELNCGVAGGGSGGHLALELFKSMAGAKITVVPYKGGAFAIIDTIGGQVQLTINNGLALLPHIKAGKLRALGATSLQRLAVAPDIPTIAEAGLSGYEAALWYGIVVPAKAPPALIARLNTEFVKAIQQPDVQERMRNEGVRVIGSTPEQFAEHLRKESAKWANVIRDAKIRLD